MIKSRYLKHTAQFQERIKTKDAAGETAEEWRTVFNRYVDLRPIGVSAEQEESVQLQVSTLELTCRYSHRMQKDITTNHRVIVSGKAYRINEIGDVFSRKKLTYLISLYE